MRNVLLEVLSVSNSNINLIIIDNVTLSVILAYTNRIEESTSISIRFRVLLELILVRLRSYLAEIYIVSIL